MFRWLFKTKHRPALKEPQIGQVIDNKKFRDIRKIQERLWGQKKVPKTSEEADVYWKDLSELCALLMPLKGLPISIQKRSELQLAGIDVPPFCDDERWHYYRWCRVKMAQQLHREKKFKTALGLWFEISVIDNLQLAFEQEVYFGGIATCVKRGKITEADAKLIFFDRVQNYSRCDANALWAEMRSNLVF